MTWFEELTGFREEKPEQVRENLLLNGEQLKSMVNGRVMTCGRLEMPNLAELRGGIRPERAGGKIKVREVIGNVQNFHVELENAGALFQVASQFNLLEMTSPDKTPELGVGIYEYDHTQGPACAIAAGAGTIYRNYFAPVNGQTGQLKNNQIDCLAGIGQALGNRDNRLWQMRNGYALATRSGLEEISQHLQTASESERDELRKRLQIGVQRNTEVTLPGAGHLVSQAYCSALPVAYSQQPAGLWQDFARLVLEAAYEATLCSAIINWQNTGNNRLYLTLLGGGAFGNDTNWIMAGIERALSLYAGWNLDVALVSYSNPNRQFQRIIEQFA